MGTEAGEGLCKLENAARGSVSGELGWKNVTVCTVALGQLLLAAVVLIEVVGMSPCGGEAGRGLEE